MKRRHTGIHARTVTGNTSHVKGCSKPLPERVRDQDVQIGWPRQRPDGCEDKRLTGCRPRPTRTRHAWPGMHRCSAACSRQPGQAVSAAVAAAGRGKRTRGSYVDRHGMHRLRHLGHLWIERNRHPVRMHHRVTASRHLHSTPPIFLPPRAFHKKTNPKPQARSACYCWACAALPLLYS